jgi:hypothetical protein
MSEETRLLVERLSRAGWFVWASPSGEIVYGKPNGAPSQFRIVRTTDSSRTAT